MRPHLAGAALLALSACSPAHAQCVGEQCHSNIVDTISNAYQIKQEAIPENVPVTLECHAHDFDALVIQDKNHKILFKVRCP